MKISGDGPLEVCFERNWDLLLALSCWEDRERRAYWLLDGICQHTCADDASTAIMWVTQCNKLLRDFYQKRTETSHHKRFLERNLVHVGMAQCMNALADKVQKQGVPCTQ